MSLTYALLLSRKWLNSSSRYFSVFHRNMGFIVQRGSLYIRYTKCLHHHLVLLMPCIFIFVTAVWALLCKGDRCMYGILNASITISCFVL